MTTEQNIFVAHCRKKYMQNKNSNDKQQEKPNNNVTTERRWTLGSG